MTNKKINLNLKFLGFIVDRHSREREVGGGKIDRGSNRFKVNEVKKREVF